MKNNNLRFEEGHPEEVILSRKLLVIDDDTTMLDIVRSILSEISGVEIVCTDQPEEAIKLLSDKSFNAVITDINMPRLNGLEVLEQTGLIDPNVQVVLMTGYLDAHYMRRAIQLGAFDFIRKPFAAAELLLTVQQALNKNRLLLQNQAYHDHLEQLVEERTGELIKAKSKLESHYLNTIRAMINAIEVTDIYTVGHSERVTILSVTLGRLMHLSIEELRNLRIGAILHDLGKIGKISTLVSKHHKLSDQEFDLIKEHPINGAKIIAPLGLPSDVHDIIIQHHEWMNGEGYPYGISGDEINRYARIVSIADSYDAMTSKRAYRANLEPRAAAMDIRDHAGSQFDPELAQLFYDRFERIFETITLSTSKSRHLFEKI
ncbi:MAG TPA: response regulator [Candidatus Cloacimonadota bacterium]|nr:response regulator [Candidatus Cloacimonadota bacterium]